MRSDRLTYRMDRRVLGDRLAHALRRRDMSLREFFRLTGLSSVRYYSWRRAKASPAERMADFIAECIENIDGGKPLGKIHRVGRRSGRRKA